MPVIIKGRYHLSLTIALRRIPLALKVKGGTDFPLALTVAIKLIEKITVNKKTTNVNLVQINFLILIS
jgi:hypothetical protein